VVDGDRSAARHALAHHWEGSVCIENEGAVRAAALEVFKPYLETAAGTLDLQLRGTAFQIKVWEALISIPPGAAVSYGDIARRIGNPGAIRAVGSAVGRNPVSLVIPCHRVIRETGALGNYRWGVTRKKLLLGWEASHRGSLLKTG
jgi:AraC family transcriptional regulator of adaptative response/methylated-DNA-[protein]-cysteine methyltransferase